MSNKIALILRSVFRSMFITFYEEIVLLFALRRSGFVDILKLY